MNPLVNHIIIARCIDNNFYIGKLTPEGHIDETVILAFKPTENDSIEFSLLSILDPFVKKVERIDKDKIMALGPCPKPIEDKYLQLVNPGEQNTSNVKH